MLNIGKDTSIFQGCVEFEADGASFRFEGPGPEWKVYRFRAGAWVYEAAVRSNSKGPVGLYRAYQEVMEQEGEEDEWLDERTFE